MRFRTDLRFHRFALVLAMFGAILGGNQASANCFSARDSLPQATIDAFLANPAQILQQYPDGGARMISALRDLVASSPATLQAVMTLLATANSDQKTAIGTGLGQAAVICVRTQQQYASEIQQALAAAADETSIRAFAAVAGDRPIAATGAGGGGGGGGGGQTNGLTSTGGNNNGTNPQGGGNGVTTSFFTYSPSVGGGGGSVTNTTTTLAGSVSP